MKKFLSIIGGTTLSALAFLPSVLADANDFSMYGNRTGEGFGCPFFGGGWGMMNGGFGGGGWGYGFLGLFINAIFWIVLVAISVYVARKVWDASGKKKK